MNREEAKQILLLYRPGTTDADDPQIAAALELARQDADLSRWLEGRLAQHRVLVTTFRAISVPAGLKEQILSEHAAHQRRLQSQRKKVFALVAVIVFFAALAVYQIIPRFPDDPLTLFRDQMTGVALHGYGMDLVTNNPAAIREFLAEKKCPADYVLPPALKSTAAAGCAVQRWQNKNVSMICFRTGKPLPSGQESDLWFFVADRSAVSHAPEPGEQKIFTDGPVVSVVWTEGEKVYLLATEGNADTIRRFL